MTAPQVIRYGIVSLAIIVVARAQEGPPPNMPPPVPSRPPSWVATSPVGAPKSFEAASVKLNKSGNLSMSMRPGPGSLVLTNANLEWLVARAYGIQDFQIAGAPGWFRSQGYDINAKAYGAPDLAHLLRLLQPLLEDRFKLKAHHETREIPVLVLTVEGRGPKVKPSVGPAAADVPSLFGQTSDTHARLTGQHAAMRELVANLSQRLGRPVIDKTGLTGTFDFKLEWTPDENQVGRMLPGGGSTPGAADPVGASLFTALKEQLGLRLEAQKGPGDVLVIDHAERIPTEN